jgi:nitrogen fixation/metabolism regulation signal transduction histidine kinase
VNSNAYILLGLTAIVGALGAALMFAVLRLGAAARDSRRRSRDSASDAPLLSVALQEAVEKLKAQERATAARAEASERLSGEIVESLTAGLLVVGLNREVRIINPAGRRMLRLSDSAPTDDHRRMLGEPSLSDVID